MNRDEYEILILQAINLTNPTHRGFGKLRIDGSKLIDLIGTPDFPWGCPELCFQEFYNKDYLTLGSDNCVYLTIQGGERALLSLSEINNPPDVKGQRTIFPVDTE